MKRKNFSGRKKIRQIRALDRMGQATPDDIATLHRLEVTVKNRRGANYA